MQQSLAPGRGGHHPVGMMLAQGRGQVPVTTDDRRESRGHRTGSAARARVQPSRLQGRDHRRARAAEGERHRRVIDSLAVYKDADGEIEVQHLSTMTDEKREDPGRVVGALVGLGHRRRGRLRSALRRRAVEDRHLLRGRRLGRRPGHPERHRRRAGADRASLGRAAARRDRARRGLPDQRRLHQPARPRGDRARRGRGGRRAARHRDGLGAAPPTPASGSAHALERGGFPVVLERRLGRPVEAQGDAEVPGRDGQPVRSARVPAGCAGCRSAASRPRSSFSPRRSPIEYAVPVAGPRAVSDQKPWTAAAPARARSAAVAAPPDRGRPSTSLEPRPKRVRGGVGAHTGPSRTGPAQAVGASPAETVGDPPRRSRRRPAVSPRPGPPPVRASDAASDGRRTRVPRRSRAVGRAADGPARSGGLSPVSRAPPRRRRRVQPSTCSTGVAGSAATAGGRDGRKPSPLSGRSLNARGPGRKLLVAPGDRLEAAGEVHHPGRCLDRVSPEDLDAVPARPEQPERMRAAVPVARAPTEANTVFQASRSHST